MMLDNTSPIHLVSEDSTSSHMNEYMRKTILSKADGFGCGPPRIIQDNARIFTTVSSISNGRKTEHNDRIPLKLISKESVRNRKHLRWESSIELFPNAKLPNFIADSTNRSSQERWSNGIEDKLEKRIYFKRTAAQNLAAAFARDLNIATKNLNDNTCPIHHDPQHCLIRPERIPSNECLHWNSCKYHAHQAKASNGEKNFKWERGSKVVSKRRPSSRNDKNDTISQVSAKAYLAKMY